MEDEEEIEVPEGKLQLSDIPEYLSLNKLLKDKILLRDGKEYSLDMQELAEQEREVHELFMLNPNELKKMFLDKIRFVSPEIKLFKIKNFSYLHPISVLRAAHIDTLVKVAGMITKTTKVISIVVKRNWECPTCGSLMTSDGREPKICSCGRRGGFRELSTELQDIQEVELEELQEDLGDKQPQKIRVRFLDKLCDKEISSNLQPGNKIEVIGTVEKIQIPKIHKTKDDHEELFEYRILAYDLNQLEEKYDKIQITEQDEQDIKEIAANNPLQKLADSLAPSIYGHDDIKKALILQMAGGVSEIKSDGLPTRDNIHILLCGDSSTGKSKIAKNVNKKMPRSYFVSGDEVTKVGLTSMVDKDPLLGNWCLKAGALCKCQDSVLIIDEMDKIDKEDLNALHTPMESGFINVDKADIHTSLRADCSILAISNPKEGSFVLGDSGAPLTKQINLPAPLMSLDYSEPIILRTDGKIINVKIGEFIDKYYSADNHEDIVYLNEKVECVSFDKDLKLSFSPIKYVFRHTTQDKLISVTIETGRNISVTPGHSIFVLDKGQIITKPARDLREGDFVVMPKKLPEEVRQAQVLDLNKELFCLGDETFYLHDIPKESFDKVNLPDEKKYFIARQLLPLAYSQEIPSNVLSHCVIANKGGSSHIKAEIPLNADFFRFLGYFMAEGWTTKSKRGSYMISFCFNKNETKYIDDVVRIGKEVFGLTARVEKEVSNAKKIMFYNKALFLLIREILKIKSGARNKNIPSIVFSSDYKKEFLLGWIRGDRGVTASKTLASDVLYLLSQLGITGSMSEHTPKKKPVINGREIAICKSYKILSPDCNKIESIDEIRQGIPSRRYGRLPQEQFTDTLKLLRGQAYKGWKAASTTRILAEDTERLLFGFSTTKRLNRLQILKEPITERDAVKRFGLRDGRENGRGYLRQLLSQKLIDKSLINKKVCSYKINSQGLKVLNEVENMKKLMYGDLSFAKIKRIEEKALSSKFVYDVSVPEKENFVAGNGGILCHNTRFDLIFVITDKIDAEKDSEIVKKIFFKSKADEVEIMPLDLFKKYISFAKTIKPEKSEEYLSDLQRFYNDVRKRSISTTSNMQGMPITPRHIEGILRLAAAHAKIRLSHKIEKVDYEVARDLFMNSLLKLGMDDETGIIDFARIGAGTTVTKKIKFRTIMEIVRESYAEGVRLVPLDLIRQKGADKGLNRFEVEDLIAELKRGGELFEPRTNFISLTAG